MSNSLQVKDVYDYAYDIAQEFDKIVDTVDIEQATPLINKVINVLELLEDHVKQLEQLEQENVNLRAKYIQWTCEKNSIEQEKSSLKQAFEELEESWSQESIMLKSLIERLKKENNILMQSISAKKDIPKETDDCINAVVSDQTNLIAKLQLHLKQKGTQLENNHATIELLNSKIEDLLKLNKSLHLRYREVKDLLKVSYSEKYEYKFKQDLQEQKISDLETKYEALKKSLAEKNEDTPKVVYRSFEEKVGDDVKMNVNCLIEEQNNLRLTISKLQNELVLTKRQCEEYKRKFNKVSEKLSQSSSQENGYIQQIFRLFLGAIHINI
ncbi:hypothetical protein JTE90_018659 [Oedothorax gibbosus]|uniref:RH1 domain-containing protein n=1 Tax=Oedothorax gibbosus TaxID=931172 RepID=A0AAV6UGM6_9ARAC|nr:hypothetical protein JTE90_018659 [Oedothorax gibbosus]